MKLIYKVLLALAITGITVFLYVFVLLINKGHIDYSKAKADYTISAEALYNDFKTNKTEAQTKYTGKVVELTGAISKIENIADTAKVVVFVFSEDDFGDAGVRCLILPAFIKDLSAYSAGNDVKIKGFCSGYDETDVKLDNCSIIK